MGQHWTLGASPFNLPGALPDPQITLFNSSGTAFASNEGWNNNPLIVAEASAAYAYPFPATSKDSAMVVTLPPGIYTVEIVGAGGDSGMAEFSVYLLQ